MHKTGATYLLSRMNPSSQNDGLKLGKTEKRVVRKSRRKTDVILPDFCWLISVISFMLKESSLSLVYMIM